MAAEATPSVQFTTSKQSKAEAKKGEEKPADDVAAKAPEAAVEPKKPVDRKERTGQADALIHRNVLWALGAGVIPLPVFDIVAITGIQMKMLKELSDLYEIKFTQQLVKKSVGALASGLGSVALGTALGGSLAKLIPGLGQTLGVISVPLVAAAFTRATGRIFLMHFEAGGTLLDFDPALMREYFREEFETAKQAVAKMQKSPTAAAQTPAA